MATNKQSFFHLDEHWNALWDSYNEKKSYLLSLENEIGHKFANRHLLYEALTHKSAVVEFNRFRNRKGLSILELSCYERLEFLGDSVLGLIISSLLWKKKSFSFDEGELSKVRAYLVSSERLAKMALGISLDHCVLISKVDEKNGGLKRESLLADCFESLIGAVYLDSDFETVFTVVKNLYTSLLDNSHLISQIHDYKTLLQERYQELFQKTPHYETIASSGPDHNKVFKVGVFCHEKKIASAWGKTKKKASQKAAFKALRNMN